MLNYYELQVTSNFSFLRGASHPREFIERAAELSYSGIAITDTNSLAGVVRAHTAAKEVGVNFIVGARLELQDGPPLLAYPTDRESYGRLSSLLTIGNLRSEKGSCTLYREELYNHSKGLKLIALPPPALNSQFNFDSHFIELLKEYRHHFGEELYLGATLYQRGEDEKRLYRLNSLSKKLKVPLVALNDTLYHSSSRKRVQDLVTSVREKCTIYEAGYRLEPNGERYLKSIAELKWLFREYPQALHKTEEIASAINFSLNQLKYQYPSEITPDGESADVRLRRLTWEGAHDRYGEELPKGVVESIEKELDFIAKREYAPYFLTVFDYVEEAKRRGILAQGRGSAANSAVCYALGITSVDPTKFKLLFARFMNEARHEPPDIDVDFEHERREEIIQYIYNRFGRDRTAIVATVNHLRTKGAIRDITRVMDQESDSQLQEPDSQLLEPYSQLLKEYIGFPRQLGQHTGGFLISQEKISTLCPIVNTRMEGRTSLEWDKNDLEALGFMKVDVLSLGILTVIRKSFQLIEQEYGLSYSLATLPQEDPKVYEMISRADTIGVFQIESRAQMSMLPRLKPRCFYDLVIEVALVRPGPIQGEMVHPYLRRREGIEPVEYPSEELEEILGRTLGVPIFQEQAMEIAIVAAGFSPAEADGLRRSMGTFKGDGAVERYREKLIEGMCGRGYPREFAERIYKQIEGFGSYGFPESHAASFAHLVYASAWLKCHYPELFLVATLNSQPMGFYQPSQLIQDAKRHGVVVRPADINHSHWDYTVEESAGRYLAVRVGFRQLKGLRREEIERLVAHREQRRLPYQKVGELIGAALSPSTLELLANGDTFNSLALSRREALWRVMAPLEGEAEVECEEESPLPLPSKMEEIIADYRQSSLSLKGHPIALIRDELSRAGVIRAVDLKRKENFSSVKLYGIVTVRQRPLTAKGVLFITIEDESGLANLVIWPSILERYREELLKSDQLFVLGELQREGGAINVVVKRCYQLKITTGSLFKSRDFH